MCHINAGQQALLPAIAQFSRSMASAHPEIQVYAGPQAPKKAVTLRTLRAKYEKQQPICMATAYDYPSAVHVSSALQALAAVQICNHLTISSHLQPELLQKLCRKQF